MAKYHGEGNRNSPIVLLTYREMIEEIVTEGSDKRWWDYSDLFNSRTAWWRMSCVMGMGFFGQVGCSMTECQGNRLTKSSGLETAL